jgi:K+-transporting ATPase c subunit
VSLRKPSVTATLMTVVTTMFLGLVYPLVVTGLPQAPFPDRANGRLFGLLAEPVVNVLLLNLALDERAPMRRQPRHVR